MISRRIIAAVALLCAMIAPVHAQKTKAALNSEITTNFPDNSVGTITPLILRTTISDILNSIMPTAPVTSGNLACFNGTTGLLQDCGSPTPIPVISGGSAANSTLTLESTSNASPSGDSVTVQGHTINLTAAGFGTTVNLGTAGVNPATLTIAGAASGSTTIQPTGVASGTLTLPAVTDTLIGKATTDTLTNKTLDTAGNVFKINGVQVTTPGQVGAVLCTPIRTVLTSGTVATFTTPTCNGVTATWLEVDVQGGGGSGSGSGTGSAGIGTAGNASTISNGSSTLAANGAATPGSVDTGGVGGTCTGILGTQQNFPGMTGGSQNISTINMYGGAGGVSFYGGAGAASIGIAGGAAQTNSGGGGAGGGTGATAGGVAGGGGGSGCHIRTVIVSSVTATYTYTVGAGVAGGAAGTSGFAGGGGAAGLIDILAHWQ